MRIFTYKYAIHIKIYIYQKKVSREQMKKKLMNVPVSHEKEINNTHTKKKKTRKSRMEKKNFILIIPLS